MGSAGATCVASGRTRRGYERAARGMSLADPIPLVAVGFECHLMIPPCVGDAAEGPGEGPGIGRLTKNMQHQTQVKTILKNFCFLTQKEELNKNHNKT